MSELRWWLVRHAPTGATGAIGWTDLAPDLSDAAALDHLAAALPPAPVVSSDLARARLTADRIAAGRPRLAPEPGLREIHFGAWEGLSFDAIAARDPEASAAWWGNPGPARAPGGEGFDDLTARVRATMARVGAAVGSGDVIAVAHMGAILAALAVAGGLAPAQALAFRIDTLSVTRLDWLPGAGADGGADGGAWRVSAVNLRRLG